VTEKRKLHPEQCFSGFMLRAAEVYAVQTVPQSVSCRKAPIKQYQALRCYGSVCSPKHG